MPIQTGVTIQVFEGERVITNDNNQLGTFDLSGISPAPRSIPKIIVTFNLDANGILNVSAKAMSSGNAKNITIKNYKGRLSQADIERMVNEAEKCAEEDEKQKNKIAARNGLESYVFGVKQALDQGGDKYSQQEKDEALRACDATIKWLDSNSLAEKEKYEDNMNSLTKLCTMVEVAAQQVVANRLEDLQRDDLVPPLKK